VRLEDFVPSAVRASAPEPKGATAYRGRSLRLRLRLDVIPVRPLHHELRAASSAVGQRSAAWRLLRPSRQVELLELLIPTLVEVAEGSAPEQCEPAPALVLRAVVQHVAALTERLQV
jgi:hypothetical protein